MKRKQASMFRLYWLVLFLKQNWAIYVIVYLFIEITLLNMNRISSVMVSVLASSAVEIMGWY